MPPVVLFEFEGVLADTAAARRDALVRGFADEQVVLGELAAAEAGARRGVRQAAVCALRHLGLRRDETGIDLIALRAERHFAERLGKGVSLVPGARELVEALAARATLGIVTRAARREVEFVLGLAGLEAMFGCIVTADDASSPKPSAAPYRLALGRLQARGLRATSGVAVEDGVDGIRAAKAAGLRCLAVGEIAAEEALEADGFAAALSELTAEGVLALAARGGARVA